MKNFNLAFLMREPFKSCGKKSGILMKTVFPKQKRQNTDSFLLLILHFINASQLTASHFYILNAFAV